MTYVDRQNYWAASQRVRASWARYELGNLLYWAFDREFSTLPEDRLEDFLRGLRDRVGAAEPAWEPAMDGLAGAPVTSFRGDLKQAFAMIRELARDIATGQPGGLFSMKIQLYVPNQFSDREGRPRWCLDGRLRDGIIWMALKLFSEVPRSLIRTCDFAQCSRVFVAGKNQRYCLPHQADAQRQAQRRAERAFRQRAKKRRPR